MATISMTVSALAMASSISYTLVVSCFVAFPAAGEEGLWRDAAAETGLDFRHWNGATGEWYFPEINGAGVALLDFDDDGDLDVYLVQGALLGPKTFADAPAPPPETIDTLIDKLADDDYGVREAASSALMPAS